MCQQIASQKVIELAIKYAGQTNRIALANKLEAIAETKESEEIVKETQDDIFNDRMETETLDEDEELFTPAAKTPDIEIKPLTPSQSFGRRSNPFLKKANTPVSKGKTRGITINIVCTYILSLLLKRCSYQDFLAWIRSKSRRNR